jgi:hypothetical protein
LLSLPWRAFGGPLNERPGPKILHPVIGGPTCWKYPTGESEHGLRAERLGGGSFLKLFLGFQPRQQTARMGVVQLSDSFDNHFHRAHGGKLGNRYKSGKLGLLG